MSILEVRDLHVSVRLPDGGRKPILAGVNLTVRAGQTHALMGPNGSGKSTLAYSIAGHPKYEITSGSVTLFDHNSASTPQGGAPDRMKVAGHNSASTPQGGAPDRMKVAGHNSASTPQGGAPDRMTVAGRDVLGMSVDERARAGLFLAMQYPVEVPGVSVANFLRTAKTAIEGEAPKLRTWGADLKAAMERLGMDPAFAQRNVNEGFSGGEKKRHEIVQLELLRPKMAILDETDSGLDIDALRVVSGGVNRIRATGRTGVLLITHYTRILRYVQPDFVHVFVGGRIVEEGGPELADKLEAEGYERYLAGAGPATGV